MFRLTNGAGLQAPSGVSVLASWPLPRRLGGCFCLGLLAFAVPPCGVEGGCFCLGLLTFAAPPCGALGLVAVLIDILAALCLTAVPSEDGARRQINHVVNITGQLRFDSRGVTNTLDSKSYSSGRGKRGL